MSLVLERCLLPSTQIEAFLQALAEIQPVTADIYLSSNEEFFQEPKPGKQLVMWQFKCFYNR